MSDIPLGTMPATDAARDAVHVAIAPVVAAEQLYPGQHVGPKKDGSFGPVRKKIGIVDPYLTHPVPKGERFFLCLYPQTVTGMRHHWSHPDFATEPAAKEEPEPEPDQKIVSEKYLRAFADNAGLSYTSMIEKVIDYLDTGDPWVERDSENARDAWCALNQEEFWRHFERVTGRMPSGDEWCDTPFSCSC